jgi:periplasmic divalent cation tolerance protein
MIATPPSAADALARALVEARAAACVNRLPNVTSTYRWAGKVEVDSEELLLVKTTRGAYPRLEAVVAREHPYDTPEIVGMRVDVGSETYLAWVRENVDSGEE